MTDKIDEIAMEVRKLSTLSDIMIESPNEERSNIGVLIKDIVDRIITLLKSQQNQ